MDQINTALIPAELMDVEWYNDHYQYEGKNVPRVTEIIEGTQSNKSLVEWAAKMGYTKQRYYKDTAMAVGSAVHSMIEEFMKTGYADMVDAAEYGLDFKAQDQVKMAFNNFLSWYRYVIRTNHTIRVIGTEVPVITPWFGGTIDAILEINGAVYVIDYKTSRSLSHDYVLQTCAYAWAINNGYLDICNHVNGIGILRFDKTAEFFEEFFLNDFIDIQKQHLEFYTRAFWSMIQTYYYLAQTRQNFYHTEVASKDIAEINFPILVDGGEQNDG